MSTKITKSVQEYYGKILENKTDLQTNACCTDDGLTDEHKAILKEIEPEIKEKFYGCGIPIPEQLEGCTVLDLGSGTGQDAYLVSKLVGESGHVIGIDMTDEQLEVANKYKDKQAEKFGFKKANTTFVKGYIEDLKSAGIEDNSIDIVISNCVINLSPDKESVFKEIFRVLKPGGEMYISDVFSDRRVPDSLRNDPLLYGECLSGALYIEDFRRILTEAGCADYRDISSRILTINNPEIEKKLGLINFYSITVRAFKLDLEDQCEDFGQSAVYNGSIPGQPHYFDLDDHHRLETGKAMTVCGNTADMLSKTRFKNHFTISGDKSVHFGLFDCGPSPIASDDGSGSCC